MAEWMSYSGDRSQQYWRTTRGTKSRAAGLRVPHATSGTQMRFPHAHERVPETRRGWAQGSAENPLEPSGGGSAQTQVTGHPVEPPCKYSRFRVPAPRKRTSLAQCCAELRLKRQAWPKAGGSWFPEGRRGFPVRFSSSASFP